MNFFVAGLPRSRTAWLANFLTCGERFCFHEALNGCDSIEQYRQKLGPDKGDSSTGLMLIDLNKLYPDAPVVIIESDPEAAAKYSYKHFGYYDPGYIYALQAKMDLIEGLRIHVGEIDKKLPEIWSHLIGSPFDYDRAQLLIALNIQVKNPYAINQEAAIKLWNTLN